MSASKTAKFLVFSLLFVLPFGLGAQEHPEEKDGFKTGDPVDTKTEIKNYIDHHLLDSHDFILWSDAEAGTHTSFPCLLLFLTMGYKFFPLQSFITAKRSPNPVATTIRSTTTKYTRQTLLVASH